MTVEEDAAIKAHKEKVLYKEIIAIEVKSDVFGVWLGQLLPKDETTAVKEVTEDKSG